MRENGAENRVRQCRLCGARSGQKFLYREDEWEILECPACAFISTDPIPTLKELEDFYSGKFLSGEEDSAEFWQGPRLKPFAQIEKILLELGIAKDDPILDVGCAYGAFLNYMKGEGFSHLTGVDLSRQAIEHLQKNLGLNARQGTLRGAAFDEKQFSVVTMNDTFEHLPDFNESLREVWRILKPGGLFLVRLPNMNFHLFKLKVFKILRVKWEFGMFTPPAHLNHFRPNVLAKLFEREGFDVIRAADGVPAIYGGRKRVWGLRILWLFTAAIRHASFGKYLAGNSLIMVGRKR